MTHIEKKQSARPLKKLNPGAMADGSNHGGKHSAGLVR
jgi:hypothetical protein